MLLKENDHTANVIYYMGTMPNEIKMRFPDRY